MHQILSISQLVCNWPSVNPSFGRLANSGSKNNRCWRKKSWLYSWAWTCNLYSLAPRLFLVEERTWYHRGAEPFTSTMSSITWFPLGTFHFGMIVYLFSSFVCTSNDKRAGHTPCARGAMALLSAKNAECSEQRVQH